MSLLYYLTSRTGLLSQGGSHTGGLPNIYVMKLLSNLGVVEGGDTTSHKFLHMTLYIGHDYQNLSVFDYALWHRTLYHAASVA